mmetsp:Transcript_32506/g.62732  ORF Transcript_32506/g.62732 Transcript_32506/m.62732 type:complete len:348 (-) Transcript_32506:34-1077(-)
MSFLILWFNEANYVAAQKALGNAGKKAKYVDSASPVEAEKDDELIWLRGRTAGEGPTLTDKHFRVTAPEDALKLKRVVEMYQWKETKHIDKREIPMGNNQTRVEKTERFSYSKVWSSSVIRSDNFKDRTHRNPPEIKVGSGEVISKPNLRVGSYKLGPGFAKRITPTSEISRKYFQYYGDPYPTTPADFKIGDTRVTHTIARAKEVTILARQGAGGELSEWVDKSTGRSVYAFQHGRKSLDEILASQLSTEGWLCVFLRLLGFVLMWMGISMTWEPLVAIVSPIPILAPLIDFARNVGTGLAAAVLSTMTIMVAWLYYRPLVAVTVIAACSAMIYHKELAAVFASYM